MQFSENSIEVYLKDKAQWKFYELDFNGFKEECKKRGIIFGKNFRSTGYLNLSNNIFIGNNVSLHDTTILSQVSIGNNVSIKLATLKEGVRIGNNISIDNNFKAGESCSISSKVIIGKNCSLGNNVSIESHVKIKDSVHIPAWKNIKKGSIVPFYYSFQTVREDIEFYQFDKVCIIGTEYRIDNLLKNYREYFKHPLLDYGRRPTTDALRYLRVIKKLNEAIKKSFEIDLKKIE